MKENYIVSKANRLVEAKYTVALTAREQKLILSMVSIIQPKDDDFKDYVISLKDFSEMLGLEQVKYTEIKYIIKELMSKTIEVPLKEGGWLLVNWLASAEYFKGQGEIALAFSPKLKPYLLQLQNEYFTNYELINVLKLNSGYSIRTYELLKQWLKAGGWECSVDLLREKIGCISKSYSVYSNFKNKVLTHSINEINEKTDLNIEYKEIKKGRKVVSIKFFIKEKKEKKKKDKTFNKKKIIREEPIPKTFKKREYTKEIIDNTTKEDIDSIRKQLTKELEDNDKYYSKMKKN